MKALEAIDVVRSYGDGDVRTPVLCGFSLSLEPGEFTALMGPSGSGKSTFLHLAAGLLAPDTGRILIGGEDITTMGDSAAAKFRRRHVGVVFQQFNLLNEWSVRANVLLPLKLELGSFAKAQKVGADRLKALSEKLGIAELLERRPEELSGGEQQRVAIARALIATPEVVLADEPTGNLDAKSAKGICELLKSLNATERSSILVVTHDPVVAAATKRVHFLKDGVIAADFEPGGDPAAVSKRYLEVFG